MAFEAGSIVARIKADVTDFQQGMATAQATSGKFSNLMGGLVSGSQKFAIGLAAVGTVGAIMGKNILDASGDLESMRMGFVTLLGSADKANEAIAMIKRDAAATPFEVKGLIQANQLLTSVTKDAGRSETFLLNVGKALSAMGKGQAELDRVVVNLQQIGAVGKASMMDLRQFAFAGIPVFDMLKEKTGLTGDALETFVSDGKVSFEMLEEMFNKAGSEGGKYFDAFRNQAGTWNQLWSNLKDTVANTMDDILHSSGLFDKAKDTLKTVVDWLDQNKEKITDFFKDGLGWVEDHMPGIAGAIMFGLIPALTALGVSLMTNPITWWIAAGFLLGTLIQKLVEHFGGWEAVMVKLQPVFDWFKQVWDQIVVAWNTYLFPALQILWTMIVTQLYPALQELWQKHGPEIIKALQFLAIAFLVVAGIIAGVIIVSLMITIGIITGLVQAVTWLGDAFKFTWWAITEAIKLGVNNMRAQINLLINFFRAIPGAISGALAFVWQAMTEPFRRAFQYIKDGVAEVVNKLKDLNPFMRHSPSLVDLVTKGTLEITKQYGNMFDSISAMSAGLNVPSMSGDLAMAGGGGNNVTSRTVIGNVNLNSPSAVDEFFEKMNRSDALISMGLTGSVE